MPRRVGDRIARLVGATPGEVLCGDNTTVQLFQVLSALAVPGRPVAVEAADFPTDRYVAASVARLLGCELTGDASGAGVALLSAVDYRTGELRDLAAVTAELHAAGTRVVWDCSHAVGAVPLGLDEVGADAAVGCSYKYLNGGPGAPAWIHLPGRHQGLALPVPGWTGAADPFAMAERYVPATGVERARTGTPAVLSMVALDAALDVFDGVDLAEVRAKSLALGELLLARADAHRLESVTPREPARRGSHVSLRVPDAAALVERLAAQGVVADARPPDLLRLGLAAPYVRYVDVWDALELVARCVG